jgi:hypothetical protein
MYLDNIEEIIALYPRVSRPPKYVTMTPLLFNYWEEWARVSEEERNIIDNTLDKSQDTGIRPLGEKVGPAWMKYDFKNIDEFYKHYTELLNVGDKNGDQ